MFKNLVVALDGSPCASHAFELALRLAKAEGSKIAICSVIDPLQIAGRTPENPAAVEALAAVNATAQTIVGEAASKARASGIAVEESVLSGEPAYEIVAYAAKERADAIVMGTHGRSGLKRLFMGSVAEAVLRSASVPVVVVRDEAQLSPLAAQAEAAS